MCPQECFSLYKFNPSAYPLCSKGLGHLLHLIIIYLVCFLIYLSTNTKTHKKLLCRTCNYSLLKITYLYLLLLVGIDTPTYQKSYDRSPTLVGHQDYFLAPLPGSEALLVSEIGKETFQLYMLFLFLVSTLPSYGRLCT